MGCLKGASPNPVLMSVMVVSTTVIVDAGAVTLHEHLKHVVCWSAAPNASCTVVARTHRPLYLRTSPPEVEAPKRSNSLTQGRKTTWSFGTPLASVKRERRATRASEEGSC
jgi:hypothetical protein